MVSYGGMRTTVDIPDSIYRRLKSEAALRGCSVKELVLRGVKAELEEPRVRRKTTAVRLPIISSKKPGWLKLTNRRINEVLFP
jgi:predicted DNA-binding ribbon-helix-helix protein